MNMNESLTSDTGISSFGSVKWRHTLHHTRTRWVRTREKSGLKSEIVHSCFGLLCFYNDVNVNVKSAGIKWIIKFVSIFHVPYNRCDICISVNGRLSRIILTQHARTSALAFFDESLCVTQTTVDTCHFFLLHPACHLPSDTLIIIWN